MSNQFLEDLERIYRLKALITNSKKPLLAGCRLQLLNLLISDLQKNVPHIGELSNQFKADLQLVYKLKPLLAGLSTNQEKLKNSRKRIPNQRYSDWYHIL